MEEKKISLNGEWQPSFTEPFAGKRVESAITVPANVEPTLQKLGLVADYMPPDTPYATAPFTAVDDWCFERRFDAPALADGWRRELVFEGIDTIGEVYLNGEKLLDVMNMHMTYRADVTDRLHPMGNLLQVIIRSSELWAREHPHDMFVEQSGDPGFYDSRAFLRKARHQWGWDNAPRLLTAGIIRPVYLRDLPPCRIEELYVYTRNITAEEVVLGVNFRFAADRRYLAEHRVRFSLLDGERVVFFKESPVYFVQGKCTCKIPRNDVELWWPAGFGEQKLYTAVLELLEKETVIASCCETVGIRTVHLENSGDIHDGKGCFQFYVNGEPIFLKGTNWKPLDPLASLAHQKTADGVALPLLTDLGCNMVRIWGGGIYEDHPFFDFCDKNGILVWQDFMLACEVPTLDRAYGELVAAEAEQVIKKLRNHPSLAVWCGDNENDQFLNGLHAYNCVMPSQVRISREVLKEATLRFDPYRDYVESSPLVTDLFKSQSRLPKAQRAAVVKTEEHLYAAPLLYAEKLRECQSIFLGETGPFYLNAATVNERIVERERARVERLWDSPKIHSGGDHQNDGYFTDWRTKGKEAVLAWFGRDFTFAEYKDYALAVNIICAEIFKDVIEYSRVNYPQKTGVLWWSLYDMWPMLFNYSVVDCDGKRKLPYYWIRQSQQDVALMAVREDLQDAPVLYAVNGTRQNAAISYTVTAFSATGEGKEIACGSLEQAANSSTVLLSLAEPQEPQLWVIRWQLEGKEYTNHFFTGKADFETYRRFVRILAEAGGFDKELAELS